PRDVRALLLLLMMMSFAQLPGPEFADEATWGPRWRVAGTLYDQLMVGTSPLWALLFGAAFPERLALDRRRPWRKWVPVPPLAVLAVLRALSSVARVEGLDWAAGLAAHDDTLFALQIGLSVVAVGGFFAFLWFKGGADASPDVRRRLRLMYAGTAVGLTPTLLLLVTSVVEGVSIAAVVTPWVGVPALLTLLVFPLTPGYVLRVHRGMAVRGVVRRGPQYALARRGVTMLQALVIGSAILAVTPLVGEEAASRSRRVVYLVAAVSFILLIRR